MHILFIGGFFAPYMEQRILARSMGPVDYAADRLQWSLIDGFMRADSVDLEAISALYVGAYPNGYGDLFIRGHQDTYSDRVPCKYVPFCNLWAYRNISRKNAVQKGMREFILGDASGKVIVVYSAHTPFLQAAVYAKKQDPSIHLCLIVTDLPQFMCLRDKQPLAYRALKAVDIRLFHHYARYVDSFVLLTEDMKYVLDVGERPYVVVEGVVNVFANSTSIDQKPEGENIKTVVYTGTLAEKYGVTNLLKAFSAIDDPNIRLLICGRGECEGLVKRCASRDNRIQFVGQLSNVDALNLQRRATVLVNPRQNTDEFTKYSFPSKNIEYLLSGNPVIAYKLDGIPDDYDDYFFYVNDNSVRSLSCKIAQVIGLAREQRDEVARRARDFVIRNKNNQKACTRILGMIRREVQGGG